MENSDENGGFISIQSWMTKKTWSQIERADNLRAHPRIQSGRALVFLRLNQVHHGEHEPLERDRADRAPESRQEEPHRQKGCEELPDIRPEKELAGKPAFLPLLHGGFKGTEFRGSRIRTRKP